MKRPQAGMAGSAIFAWLAQGERALKNLGEPVRAPLVM